MDRVRAIKLPGRSSAAPLNEENMNWKCPVCGSDDNGDSSIQCACGYRLDGISDEEAADKRQEKKEDRKLIR